MVHDTENITNYIFRHLGHINPRVQRLMVVMSCNGSDGELPHHALLTYKQQINKQISDSCGNNFL